MVLDRSSHNYGVSRIGLLSLSLISLASCSAESGGRQVFNDSGCYFLASGKTYFVGDPHCFKQFKAERLKGVWVVGFEYSVFYENAFEVPEQLSGETWLELDVRQIFRSFGLEYKPDKTRAYYIEFLGRKPNRIGIHGHMGQFKEGVLVEQVFVLRDL